MGKDQFKPTLDVPLFCPYTDLPLHIRNSLTFLSELKVILKYLTALHTIKKYSTTRRTIVKIDFATQQISKFTPILQTTTVQLPLWFSNIISAYSVQRTALISFPSAIWFTYLVKLELPTKTIYTDAALIYWILQLLKEHKAALTSIKY